ncbi:MAG: trimeric intracellular cation channel family protein [Eubacteriales bacterium]|nr:trimeric intracellular cation channel family protein [Eubacteriales bacterium]
MTVISFFEPIGIIVFALSGALVARDRKMDLFGMLMLATLTATGGGIIRDVVMDNGVPAFFAHPSYMIYIILACFVAIMGRHLVNQVARLIVWLDAIGLACFSIDAGSKVIDRQLGLLAFLFVAVISGVGGGVLRDLLSQQIPVILKKDIYAIAALIGSLAYYVTEQTALKPVAPYLGLLIIVFLRLFTYSRNIHLTVPQKINTAK